MEQRWQAHPLADVEPADPFWPMEFMGAEGQEIDRGFLQVDLELADRLDGVGVQKDSALLADFRDLPDRQDQTGFIVGPHH